MFGRVEEITLTVIPTTIFSPSLFFLSNLSLLLFSLRLEREKKRNAMFPVRSIFFLSLVSVVLLDTTQEEKLEWTKYPFGAEANTPGVSFAIVPISTWRSSYFMTRGVASRFSRCSSATRSGRSSPGGGTGREKEEIFRGVLQFPRGQNGHCEEARRARIGGREGEVSEALYGLGARGIRGLPLAGALSPAPCLFFSC